MVAGEEVNLYAGISQFAYFPQQADMSFRYHIAVFMPEIKHVPQHIDGLGI